MKITPAFIALLLIAAIGGPSCKKDNQPYPPENAPERTVRFILYSTDDLSKDNGTITFTLHISIPGHTIWDSVLAPMKIKDVPTLANKLTFEKTVPGNKTGDLQIGFLYAIENVGNSWHLDIFKRDETQKTIEYDFH